MTDISQIQSNGTKQLTKIRETALALVLKHGVQKEDDLAPGHYATVFASGGFGIAYRDNLPRPALRVWYYGDRVLDIEWGDDGVMDVLGYEGGRWENRLADMLEFGPAAMDEAQDRSELRQNISRFTFLIFFSGVVITARHFLNFEFGAIVFAGVLVGAAIGRWLRNGVLYTAGLPIVAVNCIAWGGLIAFGLHYLIQQFTPSVIVKVIAYGAGASVAMPNYGMGRQSMGGIRRTNIVEGVSFASFAVHSLLLAFL